MTAWIVINTHAGREAYALENLNRQAFTGYLPRIKKRVKMRTGAKDVLRPLFPGYIFLEVVPGVTQWRPVLSTYGVRKVVRFGDEIAYLDEGFVRELQAREIDGAIVKPSAPYTVGQEIRVSGGAFDGLIGKIFEVQERDRLVILLDILSQSVRMRVKSDQVSPLLRV